MEYGQWCTVAGKRWMITDWSRNMVTVLGDNGEYRKFAKEVVTEISDFMVYGK